jgi:hypothetical protein
MPRTSPTRKPDPRQPTFEWERGTQLALLRDVRLPRVTGASQVTLKAVLRSIDDHARRGGECWATQETIAREIGVSNVRTVKRAIAALLNASLITCERRKVPGGHRLTVNHYRIVWTELALLEAQAASQNKVTLAANNKVTFATDQSDILTDQSDIYDRSTGHGCHLPRSEKKRRLTATRTGAREACEEAAADFDFSEQEASTMARTTKTTRKPPEPRPILEADYAAAPTQHRSKPEPTPNDHRPTTIEPGSPEDLAAVSDYQSRRRTVRSWSGYDQDRVRDMLTAAGVGRAEECVQKAISRGDQPQDVDAIVEQFHGSVEAKTQKPLGPGALYDRIMQGNWPCLLIAKVDLAKIGPNMDPAKVAAGGATDLATERKHAAQRAKFEAEEQAAAADARRRREREQRLGRVLDAMPEEQLLALVERLPGWCRQFFGTDLRARPVTGVLARQELFNLLESEVTDGR